MRGPIRDTAFVTNFWRIEEVDCDDASLIAWLLEETDEGWWVETLKDNPDLPFARKFLGKDEWTRG